MERPRKLILPLIHSGTLLGLSLFAYLYGGDQSWYVPLVYMFVIRVWNLDSKTRLITFVFSLLTQGFAAVMIAFPSAVNPINWLLPITLGFILVITDKGGAN